MKPGEVASELLELLEQDLADLDPIGQRIVANRLLERLSRWIPLRDPPPVNPMTDDEARRFEQERIEFGKYRSCPYGAIDEDYLAWLADASRDLWRKLHAYLRSDRVKNRQRLEEEDDDEKSV
jgi:hypothetical protein